VVVIVSVVVSVVTVGVVKEVGVPVVAVVDDSVGPVVVVTVLGDSVVKVVGVVVLSKTQVKSKHQYQYGVSGSPVIGTNYICTIFCLYNLCM